MDVIDLTLSPTPDKKTGLSQGHAGVVDLAALDSAQAIPAATRHVPVNVQCGQNIDYTHSQTLQERLNRRACAGHSGPPVTAVPAGYGPIILDSDDEDLPNNRLQQPPSHDESVSAVASPQQQHANMYYTCLPEAMAPPNAQGIGEGAPGVSAALPAGHGCPLGAMSPSVSQANSKGSRRLTDTEKERRAQDKLAKQAARKQAAAEKAATKAAEKADKAARTQAVRLSKGGKASEEICVLLSNAALRTNAPGRRLTEMYEQEKIKFCYKVVDTLGDGELATVSFVRRLPVNHPHAIALQAEEGRLSRGTEGVQEVVELDMPLVLVFLQAAAFIQLCQHGQLDSLIQRIVDLRCCDTSLVFLVPGLTHKLSVLASQAMKQGGVAGMAFSADAAVQEARLRLALLYPGTAFREVADISEAADEMYTMTRVLAEQPYYKEVSMVDATAKTTGAHRKTVDQYQQLFEEQGRDWDVAKVYISALWVLDWLNPVQAATLAFRFPTLTNLLDFCTSQDMSAAAKQQDLANLPLILSSAAAGARTRLGPTAASRTIAFFSQTDGDVKMGELGL